MLIQVLAGEVHLFETTEQSVFVGSSGSQDTGPADYVVDLRAGLGQVEVTTVQGRLR